MRSVILCTSFFMGFLLVIPAVHVYAFSLQNIHKIEIYQRLERLASAEIIESHVSGIRPLSRSEWSRLLSEAMMRMERAEGSSSARNMKIIEDMEREIEPDLHEEMIYLKPIGDPEISLIYLKGERSFIPPIKASQHSLVYNNEGIEPSKDLNGYLEFDIEGGGKWLYFYLTPLFSINGDRRGILKNGYIRVGLKGIDLEIGKKSLWWGQGYHGGLFLTSNAEPLRMVRLTNPHPVLLPWIFRYLGPFRLDIFASRLEKDRAVPEPYFTGIRFNFKPHPLIEIGLTRNIIMGGEDRPGINPSRLWEIMFGENKELDDDLSNSIAGIDLRLNLPRVSIYGELGGEDEAGMHPTKPAYLVGLYFPRPEKDMDFRLEYTDLTNEAWYRHGLYSSGYTYKGRILGHHVGGGGRDLFLGIGIMKWRGINGMIDLNYEERGVTTQAVTERHHQIGTEWEYRVSTTGMIEWSMRIGIAYDHIKNADYISGEKRENSLMSIGIGGML